VRGHHQQDGDGAQAFDVGAECQAMILI